MFKSLLALLLLACALSVQAAPDPALVRQLADEDSSAKVAAIQKLTQTGDPDMVRLLQAAALVGVVIERAAIRWCSAARCLVLIGRCGSRLSPG